MLLRKNRASVKKAIIFSVCASLSIGGFSQQMVLKSQSVGNTSFVKNKSVLTEKKAYSTTSSVKEKALEPITIENSSEIVIVNKTAPIGVDINYIPLFGNFTKNEAQQIDDQMFLSDCDKQFKSRAEGSEFFSKMGWEYLSDGDKKTAINRFNLSWLLNTENVDTYWGLGVIEYQSSNFPNAIKMMNKGLEISKEPNYVLMVDLATVYIKTALANPNSLFETSKARELLSSSLVLQPKYTPAYMQLTLVNLIENKLDGAWESFHQGYELNPKEANFEILSELQKRKADPKGIFK